MTDHASQICIAPHSLAPSFGGSAVGARASLSLLKVSSSFGAREIQVSLRDCVEAACDSSSEAVVWLTGVWLGSRVTSSLSRLACLLLMAADCLQDWVAGW